MSPVSPSAMTKLPTPLISAGGAAPFVLADDGDQSALPLGRDPLSGPDCTMPVDDALPVSAAELLAALDRAARTSITPASTAANSEASSDTPDKAPDDATPQSAAMAPVPTPVAQTPLLANPFAALMAAAPVIAQVIISADPKTDDAVQAAKLPDTKTAAATPAIFTVQPSDPPTAALFTLAATAGPTAKPVQDKPTVDVTVSVLSDAESDDTPTFTLPTPISHHQPSSVFGVQAPVATDAMVNRHLDLARGDAWLDTLARDIAASAGTGDRLRFGLSPEHLGKLDVEVSRHDAGIAVHMTTRSEEARSIIAAAQPRLIDELRANGTRIVAADVTSQMNTQTNGQSGGAPKAPLGSVIEAAVDLRTPVETTARTATASGRYA